MILKSVHHLESLRAGLPPSLAKKRDLLSGTVNPAFKNDYFESAVTAITAIWSESVLKALRQHYTGLLEEATAHISKYPIPSGILDTSIQMVLKWARTQLGRKLLDEEIDKALSIIFANQRLLEGHGVQKSQPSLVPTPLLRTSCEQGTQTEVSTMEFGQHPPSPENGSGHD